MSLYVVFKKGSFKKECPISENFAFPNRPSSEAQFSAMLSFSIIGRPTLLWSLVSARLKNQFSKDKKLLVYEVSRDWVSLAKQQSLY